MVDHSLGMGEAPGSNPGESIGENFHSHSPDSDVIHLLTLIVRNGLQSDLKRVPRQDYHRDLN